MAKKIVHTARYVVTKGGKVVSHHRSYTLARAARQQAGRGAKLVDRAPGARQNPGLYDPRFEATGQTRTRRYSASLPGAPAYVHRKAKTMSTSLKRLKTKRKTAAALRSNPSKPVRFTKIGPNFWVVKTPLGSLYHVTHHTSPTLARAFGGEWVAEGSVSHNKIVANSMAELRSLLERH